jgi:dipeptidyl aminopeptidase/acylaminoacyl peptidase
VGLSRRQRGVSKLPATGGEPIPLLVADSPSLPAQFRPQAVSPDGLWVWGTFRPKAESPAASGAIVSIDGRQKWRELRLGNEHGAVWSLSWTRDGKALSYVTSAGGATPGSSVSNIWLQPVDGGPARRITAFKDEMITGHAWSRDGRRLAVLRGTWRSDLVMITSEEKK